MTHRTLRVLAVVSALLVGVGFGGVAPAFVVTPYLQGATTTGMTVRWETDEPATSEVRFGSGVPLHRSVSVPGTRLIHEVRIEGLEPHERYVYQVVSRTSREAVLEGPVLTFATAAGEADPYGFVVVGDTQDQPEIWRRIAARAYAERPDFLVHCGDAVGYGREKREWVEEFFAPARDLMGRIPVFAVLGNHEEDSPYWYAYVSNPEPEYHYAFRYGNAEFFMLDSDRPVGPGSEQHLWLDGALEASTATWRFAVLHHPPYSSDADDYGDSGRGPSGRGEPRVQPLIPLFERHHVDVVFCGHVHDYERSWPVRAGRVDEEGGVTYVQTGGAGGYLEDYAPTRSWFTAKVRRSHHYVTVAVHEGTLDLAAYDMEGRLFDQHVLRRAPRLVPAAPAGEVQAALHGVFAED